MASIMTSVGIRTRPAATASAAAALSSAWSSGTWVRTLTFARCAISTAARDAACATLSLPYSRAAAASASSVAWSWLGAGLPTMILM